MVLARQSANIYLQTMEILIYSPPSLFAGSPGRSVVKRMPDYLAVPGLFPFKAENLSVEKGVLLHIVSHYYIPIVMI